MSTPLILSAIREVLRTFASDEKLDDVIADAVERAEGRLSDRGEELRWFLMGPLWEAAAAHIGIGEAAAACEELQLLLSKQLAAEGQVGARSTAPPPGGAYPTPTVPAMDNWERLEAETVMPQQGRLGLVVFATDDFGARLRLETTLGTAITGVSADEAESVLHNLSNTEKEGSFLVVDCRRREVPDGAFNLPAGCTIVIWGGDQLELDSEGDIRCIQCQSDATPEDLGALILSIRHAA